MKKLTFVLVVSLAVSVFVAAQTGGGSSVADKATVLQFLELMHARAQMIQVMQGVEKQMRLGAEQGFKQQIRDATPEQLAKIDEMFDGIFNALPIDDMIEAIVPIYQKHLTKSDLNELIAFYSSPTGQKILKEMPAITAEAMQAGGEIGRRTFAAKSDELDQKIAQLVKEIKKN